LLFIGSYVGLQFYKGTLNTPTTSSSTNPIVTKSKTNTDTNTNTNINTANTHINITTYNSSANTDKDSISNNNQSLKLQVLKISKNPTHTYDIKVNDENFLSNEETAIIKEQLETQTKNLTKNYVYQTSTETNNTSGANTGTSNSNAIEKACFDKAYTYLNTSFIVIGGAILFINCKFFYLFFSFKSN
jgi:hypothetical protein